MRPLPDVQQPTGPKVRLRRQRAAEAVAEQREATMTLDELPEGIVQVLVHGLELCGAVMAGEPADELVERSSVMFAVASEHIEVDE